MAEENDMQVGEGEAMDMPGVNETGAMPEVHAPGHASTGDEADVAAVGEDEDDEDEDEDDAPEGTV